MPVCLSLFVFACVCVCVCVCVFVCEVSILTGSPTMSSGPSGAWHRLEHPSPDIVGSGSERLRVRASVCGGESAGVCVCVR